VSPEINFKDDELCLECDGGGHYMTVTYCILDGEEIDAWISIKAQPRTLRERIKLAWEALFSREPFEVNDMSLSGFDKARKLRMFAQKIEKVLEEFERRRSQRSVSR